jgi:hypothetical protein
LINEYIVGEGIPFEITELACSIARLAGGELLCDSVVGPAGRVAACQSRFEQVVH